MKIVMCNGGLGNQTFQYIFARYLELKSREEVWLDDSIFFISKQHNGFEIPRVFPNSKVRLLSSFFDEDVWEYMISNRVKGIGICQQLKDAGEDITMIAETDDFSFDGNIVYVPTNEYLTFVAAAKGNIYYHGYWINRDWLKGKYWSILKDELQFAPLQDERNKKYERQMRDTMSASLHIRRGDFVKFGWASPLQEYAQAVTVVKNKYPDVHIFLFSDDMQFCKEHLSEIGITSENDVTFVEGNSGPESYKDMQLMTKCKINILVGGSSFSYLAALLNSMDESVCIRKTGSREV